jgi:hypothetical protein
VRTSRGTTAVTTRIAFEALLIGREERRKRALIDASLVTASMRRTANATNTKNQ